MTQEYCSAKNDYERLKSKMDDETEEHKEAILSYERPKTAFFNFSPRWVPIWLYWFVFIAISCGEGVFALSFLSYAGARKNPEEYRKAKKAYEEALKDVKERGGDVEKVAEELAKADERLNKAYSARQHTFEEYEHTAKAEQDGWVGYIRTYRHANMSVRKDKTLPESFKVDPENLIKIPDQSF